MSPDSGGRTNPACSEAVRLSREISTHAALAFAAALAAAAAIGALAFGFPSIPVLYFAGVAA